MTRENARKKLESKGYKVALSGNSYIAKKGQHTYMAESLNGLVKQIFS